MASFPLSQRPFPRLELSEAECRRFHTQATELLGNALKEYEEFALIRHHQVDRRRWKPVKSHENVAVYRESRSYAVSRSLSVEDEESFARAAAMAPVSSAGRRHSSRSSSSSGGSGSISTIHELPAHQVTELELLTGWGPTATEAREQRKRAKSRSVSASGNLEQLPALLGVGNIIGSLDDVIKTVDVFLKSNVAPNGKISESAALQSCANSLLYCGKAVQCSQDKKLMWRLDCNGNSQPVRRQEKVKATQCSVCSKTFGRFLRHSIECKLCSAAMCSKCCVERSLKSVDASGSKRHISKFVSTTVLELCTTCIATNIQTSALMIAREEVMSGRFGRVAKSSMLPPSQRRSSEMSGASVATISIEDIPGQREYRARPPLQSDGTSRKGHRPQYREGTRRGHREHNDPVAEDNYGRGYQPQSAYPDAPVSERRGHAHRDSPPSHVDREIPTNRTRSGSHRHEPVYQDAPPRQPVVRRGYSDEMFQRAEDIDGPRHYERYAPQENILRERHHPVYSDSPVELDNSGRGIRDVPVDLCDLDDVSPYTSSKESIRKTTSSSGSSLEGIHTAGVSPLQMAAQEFEVDDDTESWDTFESFGDLIEIRDDLDDVDETLDTKDMEAVKRASQVNRQLWQQIADLRDAAENVYQYTKESTAMHMTQGGSIRSPPVRPAHLGDY
ncbi:hypothetical protein KRP22_010281 [Phytophthora ramorum]|nr:hypothetical protein KRP22_5850 [Phytophthora ramorum]